MTADEWIKSNVTITVCPEPVRRRRGLRASVRAVLHRQAKESPEQCLLPLAAGYVEMAFPPNGAEMVRPVIDRGDIIGYERVRVRPPTWTTEPEDRWADPDDWIPGEFERVLSIDDSDGTKVSTRDVIEFLSKLCVLSPAQFERMKQAMAYLAMDQTEEIATLN